MTINREITELRNSYLESMKLIEAGDFNSAYAKLSQLPKAQNEADIVLKKFVDDILPWVRAGKFLVDGENKEEAGRILKDFLKKTPENDPYKTYRDVAKTWLVMTKSGLRGMTELSKQERDTFEQAGLGHAFYQADALQEALKNFDEAFIALRSDDENRLFQELSQIESSYIKAEQEYPPTRDLFRCQSLLLRIAILSAQREKKLYEFELTAAKATSAQITEKINEMRLVYNNSSIKSMISWVPEICVLFLFWSKVSTELTDFLIQMVESGSRLNSLNKLNKLQEKLQAIRNQVIKISQPTYVVSVVQPAVLSATSNGIKFTDNLRTYLRPSRKTVLNLSGLAAVFGFLLVVTSLFIVANLFTISLNPTLVLMLGSFFGLVTGFGYGALRFRDWFRDIFKAFSAMPAEKESKDIL